MTAIAAASASAVPDNRMGILMMLLGMSLFTVNDALGKWLVSEYPVGMLLAIRSLFGAVLLAPMILREGVRAVFAVERLPLHLLRVGCVTTEVACFYWAVRWLPLANVMTIYMAAPLLVTALSVPILGEKVGWRRWAAVLVGFAGVVVVLNPTGAFDPLPSLVALTGTTIFATGMITTRLLRDARNLSLVSYQTFGTGLMGAATLPVVWVAPPGVDFLLLGALGVTALAGHAAMNRSLQLSPAAVVVPFQYVSIVWAVVLDLLVWGTPPTLRIAAGALLIIGSGLFVFHREQALKRNAGG
ncbi:DMT family transporter [Azospirillum canadense]|uniref:DMT family transporter n=1 Tax=Azospirillum canadense TaxID=403962 RepID=UPI002226E670|nr:DMT family transporter [Azospirillum canadense]MCW2244012.1 drug/metabolite transporter (DMT)-like permease [Azospirillum canadense]